MAMINRVREYRDLKNGLVMLYGNGNLGFAIIKGDNRTYEEKVKQEDIIGVAIEGR